MEAIIAFVDFRAHWERETHETYSGQQQQPDPLATGRERAAGLESLSGDRAHAGAGGRLEGRDAQLGGHRAVSGLYFPGIYSERAGAAVAMTPAIVGRRAVASVAPVRIPTGLDLGIPWQWAMTCGQWLGDPG